MKKTVCRMMMAATMLLVFVFAMAGCGKQEGPKGTYAVGDNLTYMMFDGSKVTLHMGQMSAEGTWELDGDKLTLYYTNVDDKKEYTYDEEADTITASNGDVLQKISDAVK